MPGDRDQILRDFIRDTRRHQLTIENDTSVFRSIYLGQPGNSVDHWRLTTWPGHLAISGDRGSYVFSRTRDMFEFFRPRAGKLEINPQYWAQKLEASDTHGRGVKEFSEARFREAVKDDMGEWEVRLADAEKIRAEVEDHLRWADIPDARAAFEAIRDFKSTGGHEFTDFWEHDLTEWSYSFLWALFAIVWGIKQYDQVKDGRTQADHDRRVLAGEA